MLQFETIDEYDNLFGTETEDVDPVLLQQFADNVKASNAIKTYWEYKNLPYDSVHLSLIGNLVNQHGIIKIDNYLLLFDFLNEKVYMSESNDEQVLISAAQGNITGNIEVYSMNDDVASVIRSRKKGILCEDRYAISLTDGETIQTLSLTWYPDPVNAMGNTSLSNEVRYKSYGIYYKLFSRVIAIPVPYASEYFTFVTTYSWARRCSYKTGGWTYIDDYSTTPSTHYKRICYGNVRALKRYYIKSTLTSPSAPGTISIVQIQD